MTNAGEYNERIYGKRVARLRAMVAEGQQTWDLSPKDVEAIKLAVDVLEAIAISDGLFGGDIETYPVDSAESPKLLRFGLNDLEFYGQTSLDCFAIAGRELSGKQLEKQND